MTTTTTTENLGWEEAIRRVLMASPEPLGAEQIIHGIREGNLRDLGIAPKPSVAGRLSMMLKDGKVERPGRGVYRLATGISAPPSAEAIAEAEEETIASVAAYGLYWDRDKVNWSPGRGRGNRIQLLGSPEESDAQIDFANQWGIYLLHNRLDVMYVGRTTDSLLGRLRDHNTRDRRNARWDRFSWFGFRQVNDDGSLKDEVATIDTRTMITILEAVMIEAFIPPLNDKGGDLMGTMYRQIEDPALVDQRDEELRRLVGRALAR